ncbi:MAG: hypothetical protein ABI723_08165 [Bacteroidia bacterium]
MKKNYTLLIIAILFCANAYAQNQNTADSLKLDSLNKANEQLKMQNDSIKAKSQTTVAPAQSSSGKRRDTRPFSERIDFDINTGFWIDPSSTFFEISPVVSYRFPKIISIGAGPTYIYNHDRVNNVSLNGFGGKVFTRAQLTSWFYAYTEYQGINNQYITEFDNVNNKLIKDTHYVDSWFVSLGINIRVTKRRGINMQALYDVLYDKETSPYYSAWTYRVGFGF